ncbi:MAG: tRNA-specific 2-thiouridylase [Patescibacteria group bacterium]|nr:tRNA-specific 2-thiouridylase [Patescibacteria group bacterium]
MKRQPAKTGTSHTKIIVGMSGGVDSSVSAALLKRAGYDVTGAFIKVWQPDWIECNWREERLDAMRAAAHLGIPFMTVDLEQEYKRGVIDYMIAEYRAGRTPNPDVMCNREVKFGAFWKWAEAQGANFIATGHYAQIISLQGNMGSGARDFPAGKSLSFGASRAEKSPSPMFPFSSRYSLLTSADDNKDQTYFLWTLNQDDLSHALFPIGGMTKPDVRKLAKKLGLPNADKRDSQGLCFIGKVDVKEFLRHYIGDDPAAGPGNVLDDKDEVVGSHNGSLFFTMGERHGFAIDRTHKTPDDSPFYVIGKDTAANTITVSNKRGSASPGAVKEATLSNVNWISRIPKDGEKLMARARYRAGLCPGHILLPSAELEPKSERSAGQGTSCGTTTFEFERSQEAITPGQSLVIYSQDGAECLGGGIIDKYKI